MTHLERTIDIYPGGARYLKNMWPILLASNEVTDKTTSPQILNKLRKLNNLQSEQFEGFTLARAAELFRNKLCVLTYLGRGIPPKPNLLPPLEQHIYPEDAVGYTLTTIEKDGEAQLVYYGTAPNINVICEDANLMLFDTTFRTLEQYGIPRVVTGHVDAQGTLAREIQAYASRNSKPIYRTPDIKYQGNIEFDQFELILS
jgi:hypothetical protein